MNIFRLLTFLAIFLVFHANGQSSWTLSNNGVPTNFKTYEFISTSSNEIYAIGATIGSDTIAGIYKSNDEGDNWTKLITTGLENHIHEYTAGVIAGTKFFMSATNNSKGYAIYSSTDGESWTISNTGIPTNFNTYDFIVKSELEIYAFGGIFTNPKTYTPAIYKSIDGGISWNLEYHDTGVSEPMRFNAATLAGDKMLATYITTEAWPGSRLYSSSDGQNWSSLLSDEPVSIKDFIEISPTEIYGIGLGIGSFAPGKGPQEYDGLLKSTNGGVNWNYSTTTGLYWYYISAGNSANSYFISTANGQIIYGGSGPFFIFKTQNITSIKDKDDTSLAGVSISPNPSSDFITFKNSTNESTTLSIFEPQGRIMNSFSTEANETTIDIGNFPNGIYFLKATNSKGTKTFQFIKSK